MKYNTIDVTNKTSTRFLPAGKVQLLFGPSHWDPPDPFFGSSCRPRGWPIPAFQLIFPNLPIKNLEWRERSSPWTLPGRIWTHMDLSNMYLQPSPSASHTPVFSGPAPGAPTPGGRGSPNPHLGRGIPPPLPNTSLPQVNLSWIADHILVFVVHFEFLCFHKSGKTEVSKIWVGS